MIGLGAGTAWQLTCIPVPDATSDLAGAVRTVGSVLGRAWRSDARLWAIIVVRSFVGLWGCFVGVLSGGVKALGKGSVSVCHCVHKRMGGLLHGAVRLRPKLMALPCAIHSVVTPDAAGRTGIATCRAIEAQLGLTRWVVHTGAFALSSGLDAMFRPTFLLKVQSTLRIFLVAVCYCPRHFLGSA